jgi:hypothetical protein
LSEQQVPADAPHSSLNLRAGQVNVSKRLDKWKGDLHISYYVSEGCKESPLCIAEARDGSDISLLGVTEGSPGRFLAEVNQVDSNCIVIIFI